MADTRQVVTDWWEYRRLFTGSRAGRRALELGEPANAVRADQHVRVVVDAGGEPAVQLLMALIEAAPEPDDVVDVGVGPLEDLLHEHGDEVIDRIEQLWRTSPPWRQALSGVWLESGHVEPATEERLRLLVSGVGAEP